MQHIKIKQCTSIVNTNQNKNICFSFVPLSVKKDTVEFKLHAQQLNSVSSCCHVILNQSSDLDVWPHPANLERILISNFLGQTSC